LLATAFCCASASAGTAYHVRAGDSLSAIARAHGTSVGALARLNGLSPSGVLLAGSTLRLPGPAIAMRTYRVQYGDTLTGVAGRFGWSLARLARANGMSVTEKLIAGSAIRVPDRPSAAPQPVAGATYTVRPGDSLSAIALSHRVSLGELADLNRLSLSDVLPVGKHLSLPANALTPSLASYPRSTVRGSIAYWANHYGVDVHLATALAWMESGFNNEMVSPAGAVGVMQILPVTWDYVEQVLLLGQSVPHDADGNVRIGVAYLHHLLHLFGGDEQKALAAYYQGARALQDAGLLPGTKQYVDDIIALKSRF
jgi:soluble lytic murein transglycosylase-like protein